MSAKHVWRMVTFLILSASGQAHALPIGFGTPPAGLEYYELKSRNFYIYHDKRAPHEARAILNSLEAARPHLELWFDRRRSSPLPVIMSAATDRASFANFITDAVEIQSLGQGQRDLAWHEYVHASMYRHFINWFGPAGSVLHLMWLPSWYVEGLAEALSVSVGSDQQALIERYHALTGRWPTYARMHSLYTDPAFSYQGYAASGAFVAYLLRETAAKDLPAFLNDYFHKSMPWYWPYSILPFKKSMPLDSSLYEATKKTGEELYFAYKKVAEAHWAKFKNQDWFVTPPKGEAYDFEGTHSLRTDGHDAFLARYDSHRNQYFETKLSFDKQGWANGFTDGDELPEHTNGSGRYHDGRHAFALIHDTTIKGERFYELVSYKVGEPTELTHLFRRRGYAGDLLRSRSRLIWQEQDTETTRICSMGLNEREAAKKDKVSCKIAAQQSNAVEIIGWQYDRNATTSQVQYVWIKHRAQSLSGDKFALIRYAPELNRTDVFTLAEGGEPISITSDGQNLWLLVAERTKRSLRRLNIDSIACEESASLGSLLFSIHATNDGDLIAPVFNGDEEAILRFSPKKSLQFQACKPVRAHTSPLLVAVQSQTPLTLSNAASQSSLWQTDEQANAAPSPVFKPLTEQKAADQDIDTVSQPAHWRARPLFMVPWLGADSDGAQFGFLSVPLMDHMQNEDVRVYFGYGVNSHYPNTEVSLTSTRFWPTLKLDAFRYQTWNGLYFVFDNPDIASVSYAEAERRNLDSDNGMYQYAYVDERGGRLSSITYLHSIQTTLTLGMKSSYLKRYIGDASTKEGQLNEPFVDVTKNTRWGAYEFIQTFFARAAPSSMNKEFDYHSLGFDSTLSRGFDVLDATMAWSLDASFTRGKKTRELQEVYRPLKIFVPGSGSGYNNLNFPIYGSGALFRATYGNSQGRLSGNYSFPLVKKVDRLIRLLYWDSLTFTAFANVGGAWNGAYDAKDDEDPSVAHGYAIDAHFDVKGVNFHLGSGIGQVVGYFPDLFASFSFDAVF